MKRVKAIVKCYGKEALKRDRAVKLKNGETVNAWLILGLPAISDVLTVFNIREIVKLYDSGL